jgi:ABC-type multidrug transport system fused ATPase/permease subunit
MTAPVRAASRPMRSVVWACLKEQRLAVALALLGSLGVVCAELLAPWPMKIIFDHILLAKPLPPALAPLSAVLQAGTWPALLAMSGAIALVALASGAMAYLQLYSSARVGHRITWRLRAALFSHLQRLSLAFHRGSRSGELLTKVASDTNLLRDMYADWSLTLVRNVLTLLAMLVVMFLLNARLAIAVTATLPPLFGVLYWLNRSVKATSREQRRNEGAMTSRLNEVLSSIALVQAFGRERYEENRFQAAIKANYESGMRGARSTGAVVKAIAVISAVGTAITVLLGANEVVAGRLLPGELLIFVAYVTSMYKPVRDLGRLSTKFARASVSAQRVNQLLSTEPDVEDAPDAMELLAPACTCW